MSQDHCILYASVLWWYPSSHILTLLFRKQMCISVSFQRSTMWRTMEYCSHSCKNTVITHSNILKQILTYTTIDSLSLLPNRHIRSPQYSSTHSVISADPAGQMQASVRQESLLPFKSEILHRNSCTLGNSGWFPSRTWTNWISFLPKRLLQLIRFNIENKDWNVNLNIYTPRLHV